MFGRKGISMALFHKTRSLVVRLTPEPICDDCIAETLDGANRQDVAMKTLELAAAKGFEKISAKCTICGSRKRAIRHI